LGQMPNRLLYGNKGVVFGTGFSNQQAREIEIY